MFIKKKLKKNVQGLCGTQNILAAQMDLQRRIEQIQRLQTENYNANRFHDSIIDSPWLKYRGFSMGGWAIDYGFAYILFRVLNAVKPVNIIECGLGQSSKLVHQYANYYGAKAITCEQDADWITFFNQGKDGEYLINIKILEVEYVKYNGFETLSYKGFDEAFKGEKFDLLVIDGPWGSDHYSRSQLISCVKNNINYDRFCILLDDYERTGEQETIEEVKDVLSRKNVPFVCRVYGSEKQMFLICSKGMDFLTTL